VRTICNFPSTIRIFMDDKISSYPIFFFSVVDNDELLFFVVVVVVVAG